jgi:hypothetical protein
MVKEKKDHFKMKIYKYKYGCYIPPCNRWHKSGFYNLYYRRVYCHSLDVVTHYSCNKNFKYIDFSSDDYRLVNKYFLIIKSKNSMKD